jgi:hypothetical protein
MEAGFPASTISRLLESSLKLNDWHSKCINGVGKMGNSVLASANGVRSCLLPA